MLTSIWTARSAPVVTAREWEAVLSQARSARLLARLALHLQRQGWIDDVPAPVRHHLDSALTLAQRQHNLVRWEIDRIRHALADLPGPVVLLKGAAYVAAGLPPAEGRLFSDVDILVARPALSMAEASLLGHGWVAQQLDPYDERYYRQWMHEVPPLEHVWRHTWLDLHHTITPPTSRFAVDGAVLLARAVRLGPGSPLHVLAPADMVLHSAVHLLQEGEMTTALRDLLDLNDLLLHFQQDAGFWPRLLQTAHELGLQVPLWQALTQIDRLFGTRPSQAALADQIDALVPRWRLGSRALMPALLARTLDPAARGAKQAGHSLAAWLLYVRSHWIRMPWTQILPHLAHKAVFRLRQRWQATRP